MKLEAVESLPLAFEDFSQTTNEGIEFWFARDLQQLFGYKEWRIFNNVFIKAKNSCEVTRHNISDHFVDINKMATLGSGPKNRALADFLPTITIKAKDFATKITIFNTKEKDLHSESSISSEHVTNNKSVRKILLERGITPGSVSPEEDIKKIGKKSKLRK